MLLTRAHPKPSIQEGFDRWQREKHLPDLMQAPGIASVVYALNVLDDLPEACRGSGYCLAAYTARDLEGLFTFVRSPEVEAAVADGSSWFDHFNDIDYETYTGNVYEVIDVAGAGEEAPPPTSPLFVERWEVDDEDAAGFDTWLAETHLPAVAAVAGVRRARTFRALRDGIPIPYYYSPGNRALIAELDDDFRAVLGSDGFAACLERSLAWELRLEYVKRDVYRHEAHAVAASATGPAGSSPG